MVYFLNHKDFVSKIVGYDVIGGWPEVKTMEEFNQNFKQDE